MGLEDDLFPPVLERNQYGESVRISNDDYHCDTALYAREDILDEFVKLHLLLQWFCNGDVGFWLRKLREQHSDMEYEHERDMDECEVQARSDGYDEGFPDGYKKGYNEGHEDGQKQGYEEATKCGGEDV